MSLPALAAAVILLVGGGFDVASAPDGLRQQIAASDQPANHPDDEWDGLPQGPGREEVYGLCSACHSLMIVKQQGLSRPDWDETLVWMVEEQGMPELDEETLDVVLDYLTEHYGPDRARN